jgi:hypothetical protein
MKLQVSFQKFRPIGRGGKHQQQELIISCNVESREALFNLAYDEFDVDLYIDGEHHCNLSYILSEANEDAYHKLIDDIDWEHEWDLANDKSLDDDQQRTDWQDR